MSYISREDQFKVLRDNDYTVENVWFSGDGFCGWKWVAYHNYQPKPEIDLCDLNSYCVENVFNRFIADGNPLNLHFSRDEIMELASRNENLKKYIKPDKHWE